MLTKSLPPSFFFPCPAYLFSKGFREACAAHNPSENRGIGILPEVLPGGKIRGLPSAFQRLPQLAESESPESPGTWLKCLKKRTYIFCAKMPCATPPAAGGGGRSRFLASCQNLPTNTVSSLCLPVAFKLDEVGFAGQLRGYR